MKKSKKNPKYLIIGATGLIGSFLMKELGSGYSCIGTTHQDSAQGYVHLNILDDGNIHEVFKTHAPDFVVLCANLAGGVDFCEGNPDRAKKFHHEATKSIGKLCEEYGSRFLYISTECVFDGKKQEYSETDSKNPQNIYGRWKAESEEWILNHLTNFVIVRTMSVFGWQPDTKTPNALMKLYFSISKKKEMMVPTYRWGTPTYVRDLTKAIAELINSMESGIFHIAGQTYISRYQWLKKICDVLQWDSAYIIPSDQVIPDETFRPPRVKLLADKFINRFNTPLHSLDEALHLLKTDREVKTK